MDTARIREQDAIRYLRIADVENAGKLAKVAVADLVAEGDGQVSSAEGAMGITLAPNRIHLEALVKRLVALIPPPHRHLTSFHGVYAPTAKLRPTGTPAPSNELPELELPHLSGFNASAPVRVGNGAVKQLQLDAYGELLQAAWLYVKVGGELTATNWDYLSGLAELVRNRWRLPDQGLWEVRGPPRHFLHSKLLCWVALDRAVRIAKARRMPGPIGRWSQERDAIRRLLLEESARVGWFPQAVGSMEADASTLLMPAFGLVSATDERVTRTMEEVCRQLGQGPLLRRYASDDGVPGDEGAFLLCSFWWVDVLLHQRRAEEAEQLLESLLGLSNDVGLWGEEASFETGEPLGNFPQAFTHMALVHSCAQLAGARLGRLPGTPAYDFSEFALTLLSTLGSQREKRAPVDTPV